MKKIAKKCALFLVLLLTACLFFAQTIRTMSSAKVDFVFPTTKVLSKSVTVEGVFSWDQVKEVFVHDAEEFPIIIEEACVRAGQKVYKGQVLLKAVITDSWRVKYEHERKSLQAARERWVLVTKDAIGMNVNRASKHVAAIMAYLALQAEVDNLRQNMVSTAMQHGIERLPDSTHWNAFVTNSKNSDLIRAYAVYAESYAQLNEMEIGASIKSASVKDLDFALQFLGIEREITSIEANLEHLLRTKNALETIVAKCDGYIIDIFPEIGEKYSALTALYTHSASMCPVVKAVVEQQQADLVSEAENITLRYSTADFALSGDKARFLREEHQSPLQWIAELPEYFAADSDQFIGQKAAIDFQHESKMYECVIPAMCVVSEQGKKYVYCIEKIETHWGPEYYAKKTEVTVVDYNESYAAIGYGISVNATIACNWSRPLTDNERVIETIS